MLTAELGSVASLGTASRFLGRSCICCCVCSRPCGTHAANAYLRIALKHAEAYSGSHPEQPLTLSAIFANHCAMEGLAVLQSLPGITAEHHPLLNPNTVHKPTYDQLYPINALRNLAVSQASTSLVLCADGDFIFSRGLQDMIASSSAQQLLYHSGEQSQQQQQPGSFATMPVKCDADLPQQQEQQHASQLQQPRQQQQQQQQRPTMLVLPAFQMALQDALPDSQAAVVPRTKADLTHALAAGTVQPFHCGAFHPQQQPIDTHTWLAACTAYTVQYCEYFEPQGVAVKQQLPLHDEAFRGYGLNKVQHAWHMAHLGYTFKVLPDAFMVTVPHKRSSSWRPTPGTASDVAHLSRIALVYEQFKQRLAQQVIRDATS